MHPSWWLTILQIILESLPISSSTHIAFLAETFNMPFNQAFDHAAHGITGLILLVFWRQKLVSILYSSWHIWFWYVRFVVITSLITTFFYFSPLKTSAQLLSPLVGLFITATLLSVSMIYPSHGKPDLNLAFMMGLAQSCALVPGISRMAITYTTARWWHISIQESLWLSCLIELPLCAGGILLAYKDLDRIIPFISITEIVLIILSALVSYVALFLTYKALQTNKAWIISLYLILFACLAL